MHGVLQTERRVAVHGHLRARRLGQKLHALFHPWFRRDRGRGDGTFRLRPRRRRWFHLLLGRGSCGSRASGSLARLGSCLWESAQAGLLAMASGAVASGGACGAGDCFAASSGAGTGPPDSVWRSNYQRSASAPGGCDSVDGLFGIAVEQILLRAEQHQPHQSDAYQHPHQAAQQRAARLRLSSGNAGRSGSTWLRRRHRRWCEEAPAAGPGLAWRPPA